AGREWEGQNGTKYIEDYVRKLCVPVAGMLKSANRIQVITANLSKGYVTRIQRRKVCEVSAYLTKSKSLALVLKEIFYVKNIILRTLDIINRKDDIDIETWISHTS
ncbi:20423_t:CDS:2, partial [Gigaspora rosea]